MVSEAGVALPVVALGYTAVPVLVGVAVYTLRVSDGPSAPVYGGLVATLACLVAAVLVSDLTLAREAGVGEVTTILTPVVGLVLPVVWVAYAMMYTGRGEQVTPQWVLNRCAPLVPLPVVYVLAEWLAAGWLESLFTALVLLAMLYVSGLLLFGAYLLRRLAATYAHVPLRQVGTQAASVGGPYLVVTLASVTQGAGGPTLLAWDAVYIAVFLSGVGIATTTWQYPVCGVLPEAQHVARDEVVENLQEGVVVLDRNGRVLDLNRTAEAFLDTTPEAVIGQQVESLFETEIPDSGTPAELVTVGTADGVRRLEVSVSEIAADGEAVGRTLVMRDVTDRETRKQRLDVLNRVLRHNLRNNLDAILGHAAAIDDPDGHTETINDLGDDLLDMSRKARDTERLLDTEHRSFENVNVATLAQTTAGRASEDYPDTELTTSASGEPTIATDEQLLGRILTELLENAVEHSDRPNPQIDLSVSAHADRVEIAVADDGPGIPERERQILVDETETPLKHGSGIGLWLVKWGVKHLGGTVSIADNTPRGATVTLSLPRQNPG